ncbi:MAG TPA: hypothetical protein VGM69_22595 [Chloroflexota bacterium]|jgi:hypothetical protein
MPTDQAICPPHHWEITSIDVDGWPHDHHLCLRCGAEKNRPTGDSASMYWDRVATPQTTAVYQLRHRGRRSAA